MVAKDPRAPTTIHDPNRVLDDHLADSLVALELDAVAAAPAVVDLGSGAGFPGLPLAIARPQTRFVLVESVARKCEFIERAADSSGLSNIEVVCARAEASEQGKFNLATARAVAPLDVVLEYAAPLLQLGGFLVAWRGRRVPGDEAAAARAAEILGLQAEGVLRVWPYPQARERHLHLFSKVRETPDRFPRRPGIALKRPLGQT
jgi:16S rRNA (guanine527-N7)-methyltransferase